MTSYSDRSASTAPPRWVLDAAVALAVGVGAVAGSYAAVGPRPTFLAAPVAGWVTTLTPDAVVTWAILTLGSLGQSLGFALALALTVTGVAVVAAVADRAGRAVGGGPLTRVVAAVVTVAVGTLVVTTSPLSTLGAGLGGGLVALASGGVHSSATHGADADDRRGFLRTVAAAVVIGGGGLLVGSRSSADAGENASEAERTAASDPVVDGLLEAAAERAFDLPDAEPLVSRQFYQVDINSVDPDLSADDWTLRVTGAVDEDRVFTYDDLTTQAAEHRFVTLQCVGDTLNGRKIDTALWTGVPIETVLPELPDECCVRLRAADDYYQVFPMAALREGVLAYRMNGQPLPRGHGRPVRTLVPGHWGEINVKWLTEIEVLEEEADGYWEERGWHGTGPVNTVAKLHSISKTDTGVRVGGHAYAGTRGIDRVEVSIDGGDSWTEAALSEPLPGAVDAETGESLRETAEDAWRMWVHEYEATGTHEVVVRAVDGTGTVQTQTERKAFPRGATGWVSQRVDPRRL